MRARRANERTSLTPVPHRLSRLSKRPKSAPENASFSKPNNKTHLPTGIYRERYSLVSAVLGRTSQYRSTKIPKGTRLIRSHVPFLPMSFRRRTPNVINTQT